MKKILIFILLFCFTTHSFAFDEFHKIKNARLKSISKNKKKTKPDVTDESLDIERVDNSPSVSTPGIADPFSNLINATADFLEKRVGQELEAEFLDKFKTTLVTPDVSGLLPDSASLIAGYQFVNFQTAGSLLRSAFQNDFNNLPDHLISVLVKDTNDRNTLTFLSNTVQLIKSIKDGSNLNNALVLLKTANCTTTDNTKLDNTYKLLYLISVNVKNTKLKTNAWIDYDDFLTETANWGVSDPSNPTKTYWQEFYDAVLNGTDNDGVSFASLADNSNNVTTFKNNIFKILNSFNTVNLAINSYNLINEQNNGNADKVALLQKQYEIYFNAVVDLISATESLRSEFNLRPIDDKVDSNGVKYLARNTFKNIFQIYLLIDQGQYGAEIFQVSNIIKTSLEIISPNQQNLINSLTGIVNSGEFIANVLEAKTEQDLENVIESTALPVGSSALKEKAKSCIFLNAYFGYYGGFEALNPSKLGGDAFCPLAPIGIEFDTKWGGHFGSCGVLVSLLDLGPLVSERLNNGTTVGTNVSFNQVFSPGIFEVNKFAGSSFSLGLGAKYSPAVNVTQNDGTSISANSIQVLAFIGIDLPILSLGSNTPNDYSYPTPTTTPNATVSPSPTDTPGPNPTDTPTATPVNTPAVTPSTISSVTPSATSGT